MGPFHVQFVDGNTQPGFRMTSFYDHLFGSLFGPPFWCHFMTTFLCHFWGHFLDPHFGSFYGHHFGSYPIINLLSLNLGVLERVSHAKRCTEHTCLNMHQIWGSPRARPAYQFLTHFLGHVLDPHFGSSFWPHFMTTFLTIILGFIYQPIFKYGSSIPSMINLMIHPFRYSSP